MIDAAAEYTELACGL